MRRNYVDITIYTARNMAKDGNIDFGYWHDKPIEEKLKGAAGMIAAAFKEPQCISKKVDRTIFSAKKRN